MLAALLGMWCFSLVCLLIMSGFPLFVLCKQTPVAFAPTALAISPAGTVVAVGGDDGKVHMYSLSVDGSLTAIGESRAAGKCWFVSLQFGPSLVYCTG